MSLIRRTGPFPPGGYPFTDPRTGMKFNGAEATFDQQVNKIIQHRLINPKVYPPDDTQWITVPYVAAELDKFQCDRLGNDPRFCTGPAATVQYFKLAGKFCDSCGGTLAEVLCPTCGGRKVTGWKCQICQKEFQK